MDIDEYLKFLRVHCWMYMAMWMILPFPLVSSARHFIMFCKGWIYVHVIVGILMVAPSIVIGIISCVACPWKLSPRSYHHAILSAGLLLLCLFLVIGGFTLGFYQHKGKLNERALQCWKISHKIAGYGAIILGFGICHTGEQLFSVLREWNIVDRHGAYRNFYIVSGVLFVAAEVIYRLVLKYLKRFTIQPQLVTYSYVENEIAQGRQLVVYEDTVVDIQPYSHLHPGADGLLKAYIGQEIGRYIYGGFPCANLNPHNHSDESIQLIETLKVANLDNATRDKIFLPLDNTVTDSKNSTWTLIGKKKVNSAHTVFRFKCEHFRSCLALPGVDHCGKFFTLGSLYKKIKRNYCCCLTLTPKLLNEHLQLLQNAMNDEDYLTALPEMSKCYKNEIDIFIRKQYLLSEFVHGLDVPELDAPDEKILPLFSNPKYQFSIHGPFGPGVRFTGEEDGVVVGLTIGIASILFVDFAAYLLRMNVYNVGQKKGKEYRIFENEVFGVMGKPNFKFILFASHPSRESSIGLNIFEGLVEFNRKNGLDNFEYHLRSKETMREHWSPEYISRRIGDSQKVIKAFIATGQAQEEELIKLLENTGIPKTKLTIL